MVKPLPPDCRLTAVFDVSQILCDTCDYADTFVVLQFWDSSWYVILKTL